MAQEIADSTLLDTWGSGGNIVEPDISKIIEGWQLGEQPPHEYMNWLQNTFGSKLNHILKNGVASWNNETPYLAGSSVQHNGNVWLCKTTNTNSAPTDTNANWKRIITVESLTTVLSGYVATTGDQTIAGVKTFSSNPISTASQSTNSNALTKYSAVVKNTGDETIAGVKTFSSSPIVPTPTTGTQAANKDYVDSVAVFDINTLTNKTTPVDTDNLALQETGGLLKKVSWANLKSTLLTYFDAFYSRTSAIFGINQTWQNMTTSRSANVVYTNNTDKPIMVAIVFVSAGSSYSAVQVSGDGVNWISVGGTNSGTNYMSSQFIVPAGWQYKSLNFAVWSELR